MACQKIVATHVTLKAGVSAYNEKHDGLIMYRVQDSGLRGQGLKSDHRSNLFFGQGT